MSKLRMIALAATGSMLMTGLAFAAPQQVKGIIVTNQNGQLTLKTEFGNQTVAIGAASIKSVKGPLGHQKEDVPATALIPGLPVSIDADDATGTLVASKIEYKASDYKTAAQIQAGVEATEAKADEAVSALQKVGQWDVKAETAVYFSSGSSVVSAAGRNTVATIAKQANGIPGYMISVLGYTDPTGNAALNQRLSAQRAQNVINLLKQNPAIQPGRVLSASAMGESTFNGAADPSTFASERRVVIRVVTSAAQLPSQ